MTDYNKNHRRSSWREILSLLYPLPVSLVPALFFSLYPAKWVSSRCQQTALNSRFSSNNSSNLLVIFEHKNQYPFVGWWGDNIKRKITCMSYIVYFQRFLIFSFAINIEFPIYISIVCRSLYWLTANKQFPFTSIIKRIKEGEDIFQLWMFNAQAIQPSFISSFSPRLNPRQSKDIIIRVSNPPLTKPHPQVERGNEPLLMHHHRSTITAIKPFFRSECFNC